MLYKICGFTQFILHGCKITWPQQCEELLQTLNLLSLQCAQFSNSILKMMDLHVTKLQKLIGELRENVIAERENCATL